MGLALSAGQATAAFLCTDPWGHRYLVPEDSSLPFASNCRAADTAGPPPSEPPPLRGAAAALGLPPPARGVLVVTAAPGGAAEWLTAPRLRLMPMAAAGPGPNPELRALVDRVAHRYGHDARLLLAIIHVESRFNPNAISPKGAIGLMQVMPATAERVGVLEPQRALFDPETNLHAGARYLRLLCDLFSDRLELAVAAYNAGEGAVLRHRREIPPFRETQAYVREVMAAYHANQARP
jgi:soluble lytic murein transglycosylase-like protein